MNVKKVPTVFKASRIVGMEIFFFGEVNMALQLIYLMVQLHTQQFMMDILVGSAWLRKLRNSA